jgi:predicted dehydrogenase
MLRWWRSLTRAKSGVAERQTDWPEARTFASAAELATSGLEVDAVEALLPTPLHTDVVVEMLGYGWHVNLGWPREHAGVSTGN